MPSADFCLAVRRPLDRLSRLAATRDRSPGVSSIAFGAQPPDLRFAPLMDMDFAMAGISPLRRRMIDDMMIRNLSPATQQSYLYAVAKFSRHFGHSPDRLGLEEVRAYQLHLIAQQRSWAHINQAVSALRFFYSVTLGRTDALERIVAAREPQKLP